MMPVWNCSSNLGLVCQQKWESMEQTQEDVRFCFSCRKNVYFCHSSEDLAQHTKEGHCVAFECSTTNVVPLGELLSLGTMPGVGAIAGSPLPYSLLTIHKLSNFILPIVRLLTFLTKTDRGKIDTR